MKRKLIILTVPIILLSSMPARADFFGGDVAVLAQILVQATQTVVQLKSIVGTGNDTLQLLQDINTGVSTGLDDVNIISPAFNAGVYGNLSDPNSALQAIQQIYGTAPQGMDHDLIASQDQTVAEVISMNRNLYDFARQVDAEKDQILYIAPKVSPQGAGRLESQALAVLIGVSTELLRTQSQMLKLMAENTALETRKEKISTVNVHDNYGALSRDFRNLPQSTNLPRVDGGGGEP